MTGLDKFEMDKDGKVSRKVPFQAESTNNTDDEKNED